MRRIAIAIASTITGLVLLFSWPTSTNRPVTPGLPAAGGTRPGTTGTTGAAGASAGGSGAGNPSTAPAQPTTQTFTGAAAQTRYGPVQVQITVTGGALSDVQAVDYPQRDPRDQQINAYAIPILNQEALTTGSARIQMISGATFTSYGYAQSLQDALDQAGL